VRPLPFRLVFVAPGWPDAPIEFTVLASVSRSPLVTPPRSRFLQQNPPRADRHASGPLQVQRRAYPRAPPVRLHREDLGTVALCAKGSTWR
jgi:hypothetical protein